MRCNSEQFDLIKYENIDDLLFFSSSLLSCAGPFRQLERLCVGWMSVATRTYEFCAPSTAVEWCDRTTHIESLPPYFLHSLKFSVSRLNRRNTRNTRVTHTHQIMCKRQKQPASKGGRNKKKKKMKKKRRRHIICIKL